MASATIEILPDPTAPCYANSFFKISILATLTRKDVAWPTGATATIDPGLHARIINDAGNATAPLQPGPVVDGLATGSASYWLALDKAPGDTLAVSVTVGGGLDAPVTTQRYSISPPVKVTFNDPDPVLAPVSVSDSLTPSETANVIRYPVHVVTHDGQPATGYPVMWADALTPSGLTQVNAYDGDRSSAPVPVMPATIPGGLLPLATDETGTCTLCLTPRTQATTFRARLLAQPAAPQVMAQVIVFDPDNPSLQYNEPVLDVVQNQLRQYDFSTINGATAPVDITLNNNALSGAPYLVSRCNRRIYNRQYLPAPSGGGKSQYNLALPVSFVQFSTGRYSPENAIDYVISAGDGNVYTSTPNDFYAVNGSNPYTPPNVARPLEAPFVTPAASAVNVRNSVNGLSLVAQPSPTALKLREGDQVTFTCYILAWLPDSDGSIPGGDNRAVTSNGVGVTNVNASQNRVVAKFPGDQLFGFDSSPATPSLPGSFTAEYYVVRAGQADVPANRTYSQLLALPIDTAPPGNWRE